MYVIKSYSIEYLFTARILFATKSTTLYNIEQSLFNKHEISVTHALYKYVMLFCIKSHK